MAIQHTVSQEPSSENTPNLDDPSFYFNREVSWLQFNSRVLEEALDMSKPLLERVKFLAIFASNLDEYFMIRVSGLRRQVREGVLKAPPDGMTPTEQLAAIRRTLLPELEQQSTCWRDDLLPKLQAAGIQICAYDALSRKQRAFMRRLFARDIFPVLTPLAFDPAHPFPHIANLSLNLAVVVKDPEHGEQFARLKITDVLPRFVHVPDDDEMEAYEHVVMTEIRTNTLVWIEDVVAANLDLLFDGLEIVAAYPFRLTRDADIEIQDDEADDLLTNMEAQIDRREFGSVVRLEVAQDAPESVRAVLIRNLHLESSEVYTTSGPLGLSDLMQLTSLDRPDLKDAPFVPSVPAPWRHKENVFAAIQHGDILLYHPYDSFLPVIEFIREAAHDPHVVAIKQTLYRVGSNSPIVQALLEARDQHKHVAVLLELKARFDEESNITWARALEDAGVHVVYGVLGLKTHAKICLVVRREPEGLRYYAHLATGNYNHITSRIYTDLGYFTCNAAIGADVADLFNALTGYSRKTTYDKLLVAPQTMRQQILARIDREIARQRQHGDGYLAFKMNALVDPVCIQALYRASQAGVTIDLQVRGICCLRPGVPGLSDTITVTSIVGRFLEHARIYYFRNGGADEVLLGSADLMPRNLDRRVEVLFPVELPHLRNLMIQDILRVHLHDNVQARRLFPDGHYDRVRPQPDDQAFSSQEWLLKHWKDHTLQHGGQASISPGHLQD
jgi:polyphosphate kinase